MCQTIRRCPRWENGFKSHSDDLMMIACKYFSKVQMNQDEWSDKCYTNVKATWRRTSKKKGCLDCTLEKTSPKAWTCGVGPQLTAEKLLWGASRCSLQPCDRRTPSNQPWHILICPRERKRRGSMYTCSHTHTHIHQRPHTQLCQQLILIESNGPIRWPRKRTPTYYCQLICSVQSTAFLRRSHFIVSLCWKAAVSEQRVRTVCICAAKKFFFFKDSRRTFGKTLQIDPQTSLPQRFQIHVSKRFKFNGHSCNHIQQKQEVQLLWLDSNSFMWTDGRKRVMCGLLRWIHQYKEKGSCEIIKSPSHNK